MPQTTGTPGSPAATTTISGKQLPAPDPKFGGVTKAGTLQSKPWWAPRIVPPKDAPNVLLILTDDVGYEAPSTFGGVIPTPTLDRAARTGPMPSWIWTKSCSSIPSPTPRGATA